MGNLTTKYYKNNQLMGVEEERIDRDSVVSNIEDCKSDGMQIEAHYKLDGSIVAEIYTHTHMGNIKAKAVMEYIH